MEQMMKKTEYFLIFLIFVFGYFIYTVYEDFLLNIIIAILLITGTMTTYNKIYSYLPFHLPCCIIITLLIGALFFLPLFYLITLVTKTLQEISQEDLFNIIDSIKLPIKNEIQKWELIRENSEQILGALDPAKIAGRILSIGTLLGQIGVSFITDVSFVLLFYFFILFYKNGIADYIKIISPLPPTQQVQINDSLFSMMNIVFGSIIVNAGLQGFLFFIIMEIYDYNGLLFGLLFGFASLIPIIGGIIMWLPIALYEISQGNTYTMRL